MKRRSLSFNEMKSKENMKSSRNQRREAWFDIFASGSENRERINCRIAPKRSGLATPSAAAKLSRKED